MAYTRMVRPGNWDDFDGVWVHVTALDDPLLRADHVRVSVHRHDDGHVTVRVAGRNNGSHWQTYPPDTRDFADLDGGPL
jgi:hypothetical protein